MKYIQALALTALLGTSVFAQEGLVEKMMDSENGLINIQKGFLYNNVALIKSGVAQIKKANALFKDADATKQYLPHKSNIAYNAAKNINTAADELEKHIQEKEFTKAQKSFTDIMNACTSCHAIVRGW